MTRKEAKEIVTRCVSALPKIDRKRLNRHSERGTPIICGKGAAARMRRNWFYTTRSSTAYSIPVLAANIRPTINPTPRTQLSWQKRFAMLNATDARFSDAVEMLSEKVIRQCLVI